MAELIPLSPVDHVFTGSGAYPLEFAFAYEGRLDTDRLCAALRRTTESFPAVASRLVRDGGAFALEPIPAEALLEVVDSPTGLHEDEAAAPARFVAPVDTFEGEQLARVRVTHTPRGSVLGVAISHAVVDGFSYFHFLSSWSRVFRGEPILPPCHERQRLCPAAANGMDGTPNAADVLAGSGLFLDQRRAARDRSRLSWTRRPFSAAELHRLIAEAQPACPVRLSHNDVLTACLWREQVPSWTPAGEPCSWLSCPVDVRRLVPGLPPGYFGCAVSLATASVEAARLARASIAELAGHVRAAVSRVDPEAVARSLRTLDALRRGAGLGAFERLHVVHPRAGLLVTNLSRLPVREVVFDAGPPAGFDVLVPAERCAVVLPAADGLDVRVCTPRPAAA